MEDPVYEAVFANSMPKIHTAFYEKAWFHPKLVKSGFGQWS